MTSNMDERIAAAYKAFWERREATKKRHKEELEAESAQERADLRAVIWEARQTEQYSIQDVANLLGLKNRNFLYKILNDKPLLDPEKKPSGRPGSTTKVQEPDKKKSGNPFKKLTVRSIEFNGNSVKVVVVRHVLRGMFPHEYDLVLSNGTIDEIPEDWYAAELTPDEVEFYRELVRDIESGR